MCTPVPVVQSYTAGKTSNYFFKFLMVGKKNKHTFYVHEKKHM